eukprot:3240153-Rhodomonas_salina.1
MTPVQTARLSSSDGCTAIRSLSTKLLVAPYARSVPARAEHHTLAQYRTSHSSIRCTSTAHRMTPLYGLGYRLQGRGSRV